MKGKQEERLTEILRPLLQTGEQIEMLTFANVGSVSVARKIATAAVVGIVSGGMLIANVRPRRCYVALTSNRVLLFEEGLGPGRPSKTALAILPRAGLSADGAKKGLLTGTVLVAIAGNEKGLKFVFPLPMRADAPPFAEALASPAA